MAKKTKPKSDDPLDIAVAEIDEKCGEGTVQIGKGTFVDVDAISTGVLSFDVVSGCGGLPRSRVVEVYGNESSGKTTFTLQCIGNCQRLGGKAGFIDAEHALDAAWASRNGVNMENLLMCQPDCGEDALHIVEALVKHRALDLIVVDSVAALIPKAELEGEMGDASVGAQARLMSKAMRKLVGISGKSKTAVVFINQLREQIGKFSPFGTPESTPGGRALKFYSSMRIELKRSATLKTSGEKGKPIGSTALCKIVKNKVAPPFRSTYFNIYYGAKYQEPKPTWGIDVFDAVIEGAVDVGAVDIRGSNYYFEGEKLANGKTNVVSVLNQDSDLYAKIYEKALSMIRPDVEATTTKDTVGDIPDAMVDRDDAV